MGACGLWGEKKEGGARLQIVDYLRKIIDFSQRLEELLKIAPDRGLSKENH